MKTWEYDVEIDRAALDGPGWEHGTPIAMIEAEIDRVKRHGVFLGVAPESIVVTEDETGGPTRRWRFTGEFRPEA